MQLILLILLIMLSCCQATFAKEKNNITLQSITMGQAMQVWEGLNDGGKITFIGKLLENKQSAIVLKLLESKFFSQKKLKSQKFYYLGMVYKAQGQYRDALNEYKKALSRDPKFVAARLELGNVLYLLKEHESAKHQYQLAIASTDNKDFKQRLQKYVATLYPEPKRLSLSGYTSTVASTNYNSGVAKGTPGVDEQFQEKAGFGISSGLSGGYRLKLSDKIDLVSVAGVHSKQFAGKDFDEVLVSAEGGPSYKFKKGYLAFFLTGEKLWYGGEEDSASWGGRIHGSFQVSKKGLLFPELRCKVKTDYRGFGRDGHSCEAHLAYNHFIKDTDYIRLMAGGMQDRNELSFIDYDMGYLGVAAQFSMKSGLSVYAEGKYSLYNYYDFVLLNGDNRVDERYEFKVHASNKNWSIGGFKPLLQYQYVYNDSNIDTGHFDSHSVTVTFTKDFYP